MNGHKWECFVFELSFLDGVCWEQLRWGCHRCCIPIHTGWHLTEYYVALRKMAKEMNIPEASSE